MGHRAPFRAPRTDGDRMVGHRTYPPIMPALSTYSWFTLTALLIVIIPGPSVLFIVGRSLALGRRAGLVSVVGNNIGLGFLVTAVAIGIGALITASHVAFIVLKLVGAAYLVYLGVHTVRNRKQTAADIGSPSHRRVFRQSLIVGFTNPKTLAFYVAVLPQFVRADAGPSWLQMLIFGYTFNMLALMNDSIWALAAGSARDWFTRKSHRTERLTGAGGVLMIGVGGALAFAENRR